MTPLGGMAAFMNPRPRVLTDEAILRMSFKGLEHDGFDWNVHHKLYRGDMVRRAVGLLDDVRLTRPDDACLSFAIALQARSYRAIPRFMLVRI